MNKKTKESVYRSKPTKEFPKGERWRFLEVGYGGFDGCWLMVRVKDGHRLYHKIDSLTLEK